MGSIAGRVIVFVLAGFVAGLLTWFISDLSGFVHIGDSVGSLTPREAAGYWIVFMAWGGFIGVLLGIADALLSGGGVEWPKVIGLGLLVGIVSGVVGGAFGMTLFGPLYAFPARNPLDFLRNVIARAIGWACIGALAGTSSGWRKGSVRVGRNGLIGGFIGGILGGGTFEIIPYLMPGLRPGPVSRLFGFTITGAMIGLFIALVQELMKEAWIRVVVGRNEGKEILIEKGETRIGRAELSDVPLFGDTNVAKNHAVLVAQGDGRFLLRDLGASNVGVLVNGERISGEKPVRNGDQIQIASKLLIFHERYTKERTAPAPKDVAAPKTLPRSVEMGGLPSLSDLPQAGGVGPGGPLAPNNGGIGGGFAVSSGSPIIGGGQGFRLIATAGPHNGAAFPARPGVVIGRDPGGDIPLPSDTKASRSHARLVADGAGIAIEDMGSTNGTYVNGQRVTGRQALVAGDTVVIGMTSLRME